MSSYPSPATPGRLRYSEPASTRRPGSEGSSAKIFLEEAPGTEVVAHRLSAAARRFKAQALIAAQLAPDTGAHERLFARPPSATGAVEVIELQAVTARCRLMRRSHGRPTPSRVGESARAGALDERTTCRAHPKPAARRRRKAVRRARSGRRFAGRHRRCRRLHARRHLRALRQQGRALPGRHRAPAAAIPRRVRRRDLVISPDSAT